MVAEQCGVGRIVKRNDNGLVLEPIAKWKRSSPEPDPAYDYFGW
jgi:hypothetical protein